MATKKSKPKPSPMSESYRIATSKPPVITPVTPGALPADAKPKVVKKGK